MTPAEKPADAAKVANQPGKLIRSLSNTLEGLREFCELAEHVNNHHHAKIKDLDAEVAINTFVHVVHTGNPEAHPMPEHIAERIRIKVERYVAEGLIQLTRDDAEQSTKLIPQDPETTKKFKQFFEILKKQEAQVGLLYQSALLALISSCEVYLASLFALNYKTFPDTIPNDTKTFSLADIQAFNSFEEAQEILIARKVEGEMFGSFDKWLEFCRQTLKLSMSYLDPVKDEMVEVFQRRNVWTHNGGHVSWTYINNVKQEYRDNRKVGDKLEISLEYVQRAIDLFQLQFTLIGLEYWKRIDNGDVERARLLDHMIFENLTKERWHIAESLSKFLAGDARQTEDFRLIAHLNNWLSIKCQGKFDSVRKDVSAIDFSAKAIQYELGRVALLEDIDRFVDLAPAAVSTKQISLSAIQEWPIFRFVRSDSRVQELLLRLEAEASTDLEPIGEESQE